MKKLLLVSLCFLMFCITQVFAQNRTVTGTVTAKDDGLPIPGVTVKVKGTAMGVQTNSAGKYSIVLPEGGALVFTFIGYEPLTVTPSGVVQNVQLVTSSKQLGEVMVTGALGIKHQAKELGYAATNITAKELTETHPTNFTNGLTAKAPGLVINTLDNGINPATRFTLRGNRHINGNNYALVILNGVPISPNDVNTINPDDIETIDILNGGGGAALYGSEASNGAIVITTKHGTLNGAPQITYSNSFLAEKISYFPALQTSFGSYGGEGGLDVDPTDPYTGYVNPYTGLIDKPVPYENQSYGPRYDGSIRQLGLPALSPTGPVQMIPYQTQATDPRRGFFQTGFSDQNNISYAQGDQANSFNLSANNLARKGVVPNDRYDRSVVRVSATRTYGIFKGDFTASYERANTSTYGGGYGGTGLDGGTSLLSALLNLPSWVPLQNYKNINAQFADVNSYFNSYSVNPYWIIANSRYNTQSDNFNGSFTGTITPTKWFNAIYRIADNYGVGVQQYTRQQVDFSAYYRSDYQGTQNQSYGYFGGPEIGPGSIPGQVQNITQYGDGSIINNGLPNINNIGAGPQGYARLTQDVLLNFHNTFFNDFKTNLLLGSTIWGESVNQISNSSVNLLVKDFYNIGSILGTPSTNQWTGLIHQIDFLGDLSLSYKDFAFIDVSGRQEKDSRLAASNRSFFYPSVKGSFSFVDAIPALKNNKIISYGKLRASWSKVGDVNTPPYSINNVYSVTPGFPYGNTGGLNLNTTLNNPNLKPEFTKETEFGADLGFFNGRINGSITYYKTNTTNQTLPITTDPASGALQTTINAGEVESSGLETKLDLEVLTKQKNGFQLTLGGNFSIQNSKVLSLTNGQSSVILGGYKSATTGAAAVAAVVGQPYPVLLGTDLVRDPLGRVIVSTVSGNPTVNSNLSNLGRTTPKYILGLTQTFGYKFVSLSITSEYRTGNVIFNRGLLQATAAGSSALSASSGRQRFVFPNSVVNTGTVANPVYTPNTNYTTANGDINFFDAGAFYPAASSYVVSGAFWKLREADLNFDLTSLIKKSKIAKKASFSIIGRNLLMWRPNSNTWSDPEFATSQGNDVGYSNNQLPPTRLFGANLNVTF